MKNIFEPHIQLIKNQYPDIDIDGWEIEMESVEIDEMDEDYSSIYYKYNELIDDGYFNDYAIEKALESFVIKSKAPKGYLYIRLVRDGEFPMLLLVKCNGEF